MPVRKSVADKLKRYAVSGECWLWSGCIDRCGYGKIGRCPDGESLAHRAAYKHFTGPIPDDCEIDHLCKVRRCINPAHLEAVPHAVNVSRGDYTSNHRNGRKTHCKRGHPLSGENLILKNAGGGYLIRQCKACLRERLATKQSEVPCVSRSR